MKRALILILLTVSLVAVGIRTDSLSEVGDTPEIMLVGDSTHLLPGQYNHGIKFLSSVTMPAGSYSFDGPVIIPQGVDVVLDPGKIAIHADNVNIGGTVTCSPFTGNGLGGSSGSNGQPGSGTGGGLGGTADGGGGGGASYGDLGTGGQSGSSNGGNRGNTYGYPGLAPGSNFPTMADIQHGSVGGGGAGGDGVIGGNGGAGGGVYFIDSMGTITISGVIDCNGANGGPGDGDTGNGSGGGGGGSGGGILLWGREIQITGDINTQGGLGGAKGTGGIVGVDGGKGGDGGLGRIKIFYQELYNNTGTLNGVTHTEQLVVPQVSITTPHFGQVYQPDQEIPLTITNSNGSYEYAWDNGMFSTVLLNFNATTPMTEGPHTLDVRVYSDSSKYIEVSYSIVVDGSAPVISAHTQELEFSAGTQSNVIIFTASDPHAGSYNVLHNGSLVAEFVSWSNGSNQYLVDGLPLGIHNITVLVSDYVWNTATFTTLVNVTQNVVTVTSPVTETVTVSNTSVSTITETVETTVSTDYTSTTVITNQKSEAPGLAFGLVMISFLILIPISRKYRQR